MWYNQLHTVLIISQHINSNPVKPKNLEKKARTVKGAGRKQFIELVLLQVIKKGKVTGKETSLEVTKRRFLS